MPKQLWKSLDEYYGAPAVDAAKASEFNADVEQQLQAIRREYGIDDDGNLKDSSAPRDTSSEHIEDLRQVLPSTSRRGFLKLSGAAAVFGMAGCWHKAPETLVPYVQQPENQILAKGVYYSSLLRNNGFVRPVMVKLYDGRPIKIEGNPDNAGTKGTLDINGQAALLDLYDPDRRVSIGADDTEIDGPLVASADGLALGDWDAIDAQVGASMKAGKVGLITGPWNGPSRERLAAELDKALGGRLQHAAYHPYAQDVARKARAISFGAAAANDPVYHVADADLLVTLGSDFLGGGTARLEDHVQFGEQRRVKGHGATATMGQLIAFEATVSQTGTSSDFRSRVSMEDMTALAWHIAKQVAAGIKADFPAAAERAASEGKTIANEAIEAHPALPIIKVQGEERQQTVVEYTIDRLIDIKKHEQHSLIYVGGAAHTGEQSLGLYLAANYLNAILGNEGVTVDAPAQAKANSLDETAAVLKAAAAKQVKTLIIADANLAYDWPDRAAVEAAIAGAELTVVVADRVNETAALSGVDVVLPSLHDLESWGDASPRAGTYYIQQPCVLPLWNARALEETLMAFAVNAGAGQFKYVIKEGETFGKLLSFVEQRELFHAPQHGVQSWHEFVQATWLSGVHTASGAAASANDFWRAALSRGVIAGKSSMSGAGSLQASGLKTEHISPTSAVTGISLICNASRIIGDGSQSNNAWLQEAGDPVSRNAWDNYAAISIADAHELEVRQGQVLKITSKATGKTAYLPAHIQPGTKQGTIETFLGWGREKDRAGAVANDAGYAVADNELNAYALSGDFNRWGVAIDLEVTDDFYEIPCLQGHNYMEGRAVALDDVLESHKADPAVHDRGGHHHTLWESGKGTTDPATSGIASADASLGNPNNLSLWDATHVYTGRRWGMAIDMNTCTGCNACVVACSAENNVPVVGRDEVRNGREMHWIRIDRYYSTFMSAEDKDNLTESEKVEGEGYYGSETAADDSFLEFIQQPMLCQQCGHAPCEEVCPAMATMHNEEGINLQVYNRCIGTRYCANNCPYKVRRFNFYEYSKYRFGPQGSGDPLKRVVKNVTTDLQTSGEHELLEAPLQMMLNPAVTVRSKGVMEKCNFCVTRTRDIREEEKRTNKKYDETTMTTACAQTCPTQAITFGDMNDPDSMVSQIRAHREHRYEVLDNVLNTRPAVSYLRRIRNRPGFMDEETLGVAHHDVHGNDDAHKEGAHDHEHAHDHKEEAH